MALLPPLQQLGFGIFRWRLQRNATSALRAGEGGIIFFLAALESAPRTERTSGDVRSAVAIEAKADMARMGQIDANDAN
jgi:hypothetical protein